MTEWRSPKLLGLVMVCLWLASLIVLSACGYQTSAPASAPTQPAATVEKTASPPAPSQGSVPAPSPAQVQPSVTQPPPVTQQPTLQQSSGTTVDISGFAFSPATINVPVGATVTWTNRDSVPHTVTSLTGVFDSGSLSRGATFSFTFNQAGTFQYRCDIHTYMTGRVVVGAGTTSSTSGTTTPPPSGSSSGSSGSSADYNY